jgi:hypothetical protein
MLPMLFDSGALSVNIVSPHRQDRVGALCEVVAEKQKGIADGILRLWLARADPAGKAFADFAGPAMARLGPRRNQCHCAKKTINDANLSIAGRDVNDRKANSRALRSYRRLCNQWQQRIGTLDPCRAAKSSLCSCGIRKDCP